MSISELLKGTLLCGCPIFSTVKSERILGIKSSIDFYNGHVLKSTNRTTLAIDVGIKNFSYCKSEGSSFPLTITKWDKINLDAKYGMSYSPMLHKESLLDKKRYLNHIASKMIDDKLLPWADLVVIESQRTRSNNNSSTLPNALLNHTLENLIFSKRYPGLIIPMTSNQMISFWFNRFINKESMKKLKSTKVMRMELTYNWLDVLFTLPSFNSQLSNRNLLDYLGLDRKQKTDDLIDSLLYNLTLNCTLGHLRDLSNWIEDDGRELTGFVEEKNKIHLHLIRPIIEKYDLEVKDDFKELI
ncbi:uncharacterized protein SPAPADRAFT_59954 [Spathaspora passalidarum NRRL Y-27907]|uniref:Mitochondrial resolvase Ydc2 catalytic domain-containing protein n=1 Tax=Spathaspora passalidarum (strain NRRL Y-27907 / 11-Y1) TaxID=619300 RepID=G3AJ09_SPAPN|nr:uncharacterized protein SPAPADRAFT_59954 [Spathaspora passalidarum NRRL Y-27907]EGW34521.1 hypothetical protein SPAPADRAFT_59954 [Spathaspora passalidarum NRRL Y-27907]